MNQNNNEKTYYECLSEYLFNQIKLQSEKRELENALLAKADNFNLEESGATTENCDAHISMSLDGMYEELVFAALSEDQSIGSRGRRQ